MKLCVRIFLILIFGLNASLSIASDYLQDYYQLLQISNTASPAEIKSAYRRLAMQYHPDHYDDAPEALKKEMEKKFKAINEAYSTLSDSNKRMNYDLHWSSNYKSTEHKAFLNKNEMIVHDGQGTQSRVDIEKIPESPGVIKDCYLNAMKAIFRDASTPMFDEFF